MGVATGGSRRRTRDIRAGHQHGVSSSLCDRRYLTVTGSVPTSETLPGILDGGSGGSAHLARASHEWFLPQTRTLVRNLTVAWRRSESSSGSCRIGGY
jgi:hypothetical protein